MDGTSIVRAAIPFPGSELCREAPGSARAAQHPKTPGGGLSFSFLFMYLHAADRRQSLPAPDADGHRQGDEDQTGPGAEDLPFCPHVQEFPGPH